MKKFYNLGPSSYFFGKLIKTQSLLTMSAAVASSGFNQIVS